MDIKALLDVYERLEQRINAYWTYWSVAIFALGGWLFSGGGGVAPHQKLPVVIALSIFFLANLGVLLAATRLAIAVLDEVAIKVQANPELGSSLRSALLAANMPYRVALTLLLHLGVDIAAISLLLSTAG